MKADKSGRMETSINVWEKETCWMTITSTIFGPLLELKPLSRLGLILVRR